MEKSYSYTSLIEAYCRHLKFKDKAPELASFHTGLYRALSELFGVDFEVEQSNRQEKYLLHLFRDAARQSVDLTTPFSGYLEAPEAIAQLYQLHGRKLNAVNREMSTNLHLLTEDIFARVYGPVAVTFTSADLRQKGFNDSDPPEPIDFL